jgi:hypothetical protein
MDRLSRWHAIANATVFFIDDVQVSLIDAPTGVTVITPAASNTGMYKRRVTVC